MKKLIILAIFFVFALSYFETTIFIKKEYASEADLIFENNAITEDIQIEQEKENNEDTNVEEFENEINIERKETNDNLIDIGVLEIPILNLKGEIKEGTSNDVIDKYIGHFECTNIWNGNVAICAHNNGFANNYFSKLNELKIGDEIIYSTNYGIKKYMVKDISEIDEKDVYVLDETKDNKITLITCISGKTNKRLCVQAVEERKDIK